MAEGTMPWQTASADGDKGGSEHFKYQYHPGGDRSKAPKNAPSALHSVIIPNVTLKKVCSLLTGGGKQSADKLYRVSMINSISGVKRVFSGEGSWQR